MSHVTTHLAEVHQASFCFVFRRPHIMEYEYINPPDEDVPFVHLTCFLCQTLAVMPVRLEHTIVTDDCGTVMCLAKGIHGVHTIDALGPNVINSGSLPCKTMWCLARVVSLSGADPCHQLLPGM